MAQLKCKYKIQKTTGQSAQINHGEFWLMLGSSKKRHRILVMSVMPSHHVLLCKVGGGQLFMSGWLAAVTIVFT